MAGTPARVRVAHWVDRLLDEAAPLAFLVEANQLSPPPASQGDRFVSGWLPFRWHQRLRLLPGPASSRIEFVNLAAAPRTLELNFFELSQPQGASVRVVVEGHELGSFALAPMLAVPIPAGLRSGRIAIELSQIDHVDSMFVAWMLQLGQFAAPIPVELRKLTPSVAIQLRQLRIDLVLNIRT